MGGKHESMTGSERRDKIIATMQENRMPVPGKELASFYNVSRQVIVQPDMISYLRTEDIF